MAYQIGTHEKPGDGLKRVAREEIAGALARIGSGAPSETVLHEVRKHLKKLRALLRMAREKPADPISKNLAALLRNTSRRIAGLRDTQVQILALKKVEKKCGDSTAPALCQTLRTRLARRATRTNPVRLRRETAAQLKKAALLLEKWPREEPEWPALWSAWKKARRINLKRMKLALANPGNESLHEWRKRAKTWWYQTRLLAAHSPKKMGRLTRNLETLTEWLGADHDLALVEQTLQKIRSPAKAGLLSLLQKDRARLQKKAAKLARKSHALEQSPNSA